MNAGGTSYRTANEKNTRCKLLASSFLPVTGQGLGCEVSAACRYQEGLHLKSVQVRSAFEVTAKVVQLYDYLNDKFSDAYIANDGKHPNQDDVMDGLDSSLRWRGAPHRDPSSRR